MKFSCSGIPDPRKLDVVLVELTHQDQARNIEHVVHPAMFHFRLNPEAAQGGLGHHRPGGGFFGDRQRSGKC